VPARAPRVSSAAALRALCTRALPDGCGIDGDNTFVFPPAKVTGYSAGPGWDPVTGWGTPDAAVLVPLLARS
jgi:hypothetical protein